MCSSTLGLKRARAVSGPFGEPFHGSPSHAFRLSILGPACLGSGGVWWGLSPIGFEEPGK